MKNRWRLEEARNRLDEILDKAVFEGPQRIVGDDNTEVVVLSSEAYARLKRRETDLVTFFRRSPLKDLTFDRNKDLPRETDL